MSRPTRLHPVRLRGLAAALLLGACLPAAADPPAAPEKAAPCAACHGADGRATLPIYPSLAGQYSSYLEHALKEYRDGSRKNLLMTPQAAALTDADIRQLAEFYSQLPGPLYTPSLQAGR